MKNNAPLEDRKPVGNKVSADFDIKHVPLPREMEAEWHEAIHHIAELLSQEYQEAHAHDGQEDPDSAAHHLS